MDLKVTTALCAESCFHSSFGIHNSSCLGVFLACSTVDTKSANTIMQNAWDVDREVRTQ